MKKLLVFSVSILCLSLALAIVLHQFGEFAVASSAVPMATEVITDAGIVFVSPGADVFVPWPSYPDGTPAILSECSGLATQLRIASSSETFNYNAEPTTSGLRISSLGAPNRIFRYLIICTRSAPNLTPVEESTWGRVKELYKGE